MVNVPYPQPNSTTSPGETPHPSASRTPSASKNPPHSSGGGMSLSRPLAIRSPSKIRQTAPQEIGRATAAVAPGSVRDFTGTVQISARYSCAAVDDSLTVLAAAEQGQGPASHAGRWSGRAAAARRRQGELEQPVQSVEVVDDAPAAAALLDLDAPGFEA